MGYPDNRPFPLATRPVRGLVRYLPDRAGNPRGTQSDRFPRGRSGGQTGRGFAHPFPVKTNRLIASGIGRPADREIGTSPASPAGRYERVASAPGRRAGDRRLSPSYLAGYSTAGRPGLGRALTLGPRSDPPEGLPGFAAFAIECFYLSGKHLRELFPQADDVGLNGRLPGR